MVFIPCRCYQWHVSRRSTRTLRFSRYHDAFLYRYSPRDGTPATRLPAAEFVDQETSGRRLSELITLHREIQREIQERELGAISEVLVEHSARTEGDMLGRTATNKVVVFPGDESLVGNFCRVRLVSTTGATFIGEPVQ